MNNGLMLLLGLTMGWLFTGGTQMYGQDFVSEAPKWLAGEWESHMYEGDFVLAFTSHGEYRYRFENDGKLMAEHTGTFEVRQSKAAEESSADAVRGGAAWPAVDGGIGTMPKGQGLVIRFRPTSIRKRLEDARSYLLGNDIAEFRVAFKGTPPSAFRILHVGQGPGSQNGQLRFTKGGRP